MCAHGEAGDLLPGVTLRHFILHVMPDINFGGDNYMKFSQEQLMRGTPKVVL